MAEDRSLVECRRRWPMDSGIAVNWRPFCLYLDVHVLPRYVVSIDVGNRFHVGPWRVKVGWRYAR